MYVRKTPLSLYATFGATALSKDVGKSVFAAYIGQEQI